jgi:hypothetical protein
MRLTLTNETVKSLPKVSTKDVVLLNAPPKIRSKKISIGKHNQILRLKPIIIQTTLSKQLLFLKKPVLH